MQRFPENTRRGLAEALEAGADYIEFDLQMNADRELIVIHDDNFVRTAGINLSVFSADTRTCREISVHQPDRFGDRYQPEPVTILAEILPLLARYPATRAMVEIKEESIAHWGLETVMTPLINALEPRRGQCVLISFSVQAIAWTQRNSSLATGWVLRKYDQASRQRAAALQPDYLMADYELLAPGEPPWPEFRHWMLYDIVDPVIAIEYAQMGVELIETADISTLRAVFS